MASERPGLSSWEAAQASTFAMKSSVSLRVRVGVFPVAGRPRLRYLKIGLKNKLQLQVRRLVSAEPPWLLIQRFVPSKFFSVSLSDLLAVHKAIGLFPESRPGRSHDLRTLVPFATLRAA
jgi:hypothetical protein